jgi:hypothetical protein
VAIWLPGYQRVNLGLSGKPFEYTHNPKGLLHSTEGTSLAGAESAMRAYPSHLGYDYRTRDKHQYISLDLAAYSAMDESDNDPIYQVELVGFAKDMRYLPDWALRNIAEDVVKPLADTVGIPPVVIPSGFKDGLDGIYPYLASPQSPIRLSYAGLRAFSGWLGHQHLPAPDDHWDPGAINIHRLLEIAYGDDMTPQELFEYRLYGRRRDDSKPNGYEEYDMQYGALLMDLHSALFQGHGWNLGWGPGVIPRLQAIQEQDGETPTIDYDRLADKLVERGLNIPTPEQYAQAVVAEFKKAGN